jgi:malonyl-CoA O-methyltransferase
VSVLAPADGYRLWAPRYAAETAVSWLEERTVESLRPPVRAGRLLDVGCGTARRLLESGATLAVGVDLTVGMLAQAPRHATIAAADIRALPFADAAFDIVWCRLVIGHVRELDVAYAELGRVCRAGGTVIVTDFHPDAAAAGHRRTFADAAGQSHEIEHHVHDPAAQCRAASAGGLSLIARRDAEVSPMIRGFYERAGRLDAYEAQRGLRLVLALAFSAA